MALINKNVIENPNPSSSKVVLVDTAGTELETSYPNGAYAVLSYAVNTPDVNATINADNLSSINMNTDEVETLLRDGNVELSSLNLSVDEVSINTSYQDTPFSNQLSSVSNGSADQITSNAKKGWMTLSVDTDASDVVYVGASGVTVNTGYKLSSSNPTLTVSSDDLSEWYVTGAVGGESLFILGAYIG